MGLDMYLTASKYVGGWNHNDKKEKELFNKVVKSIGLTPNDIDKGSPHFTIDLCVGYWRKANSIHQWFVDNVQDGKDECQRSYVSNENLEKLLKLCKEVLTKKDFTLLPPSQGFFFGSQEIDDWYWDDIKNTIEIIENVLSPKFEGFEFYYQSSW
jgi:hypothetical protein